MERKKNINQYWLVFFGLSYLYFQYYEKRKYSLQELRAGARFSNVLQPIQK